MLFIFGRLSKANEIIKLILIENAKYGAATDSSRKGQKFFCKNFFFVKNYFTITCKIKRLIKVFVYQIVAYLILYKNKH